MGPGVCHIVNLSWAQRDRYTARWIAWPSGSIPTHSRCVAEDRRTRACTNIRYIMCSNSSTCNNVITSRKFLRSTHIKNHRWHYEYSCRSWLIFAWCVPFWTYLYTWNWLPTSHNNRLWTEPCKMCCGTIHVEIRYANRNYHISLISPRPWINSARERSHGYTATLIAGNEDDRLVIGPCSQAPQLWKQILHLWMREGVVSFSCEHDIIGRTKMQHFGRCSINYTSNIWYVWRSPLFS